MLAERDTEARAIGRYVLFREVAHGGMATVHLGRLRGPAGFARTVAIKRLHAPYARDPEFVSMFLEEARLAARIQHPNVVSVLDVVATGGELFLVMDYVHGEALSKLLRAAQDTKAPVPIPIVAAIVYDILEGLHAAHEARSERGDPLGLVHRDVSPQNVMVGVDGVARLLDFGIAKATERMEVVTREGHMKGKLPYMPVEQVIGSALDRRADVYAAAVVLWEALAGTRLYPPCDMIVMTTMIAERVHAPPSEHNPEVPAALDAVVMKGLARRASDRYVSAREMAIALEQACPIANPRDVAAWVKGLAAAPLDARAASIAEVENSVLPSASPSEPPRGPRVSRPESATEPPGPSASTSAVIRIPGVDRRRRLLAAWLAGAAALVVVVLGLRWIIGARAPAVSSPAAATSSAPIAAAVPPPPVPSEPPPPPPSASASASPPAPPSTTPAPAATPPRASPPRAVARPPAANCNPPYTIDANGVRVPKRSCF